MFSDFLKSILRSPLGNFFGYVGRPFLKNSLAIFLYHDVSDTPSEFSRMYDLNVPPRVFRFQMQFIKKYFNIVSPDDILRGHIPPRAALVTFDDGLRGYFQNAVPILSEYKIPSIIFLNMEPIQGGVFWSGLITYLCSKRPDFVTLLKRKSAYTLGKKPLYLYCAKSLVKEYLERQAETFKAEVEAFIGEFAREDDLCKVARNPLIFFGNHLFNHEVPMLMSDEALVDSFSKNTFALKQYSCYRDWFSFPFGQPTTCFTDKQVVLIRQHGAQKICSAYPLVNFDAQSSYLHRIALNASHDSVAKIWFQIWSRTVRDIFTRS
ncbi:MAG: polysaccharide deacetylase family protein [bacterium]|nr:polysaccharide deacetylase family protein [bacterium]